MTNLTFKEKIKNFLYKYKPRLVKIFFNKGSFDITELLKILPSNPVILEIGASVGLHTVQFRGLFSNAIIHSFEPAPQNFKKLLHKTQDLGIYCHNIALGSFNGTSKFYISTSQAKNADSSSLYKPTKHLEIMPEIVFNETIKVQIQTLEEWTIKNSISKIDFLWIDTQGSELDILKNAGSILDTVKAIHLEVNFVQLYENIPLYDQIKFFLESQGFIVFKELFQEDSVQGDVVFIKKYQ